jgi:hypothetical protein
MAEVTRGAITYSVEGFDQLLKNIDGLQQRAEPAGIGALFMEAEAIMADSKEHYVPVDLGPLRASGTVHPPTTTGGEVHIELSYGGPAAPYAEAVHENPRAGKTDGFTPSGGRRKTWAQVGQWKYLETPFLAAQAGMLGRIADRLRGDMGIR